MQSSIYTPPTIELTATDTITTKHQIKEALSHPLNPMFIIKQHKVITQIEKLLDKLESERNLPSTSNQSSKEEKQYCLDFESDFTKSSLTPEELTMLKNDMKECVVEIMDFIIPRSQSLNQSPFSSWLKINGKKISGKQCIRFYPSTWSGSALSKQNEQRLGPHVDGNFLTILYSSKIGLQVPKLGVIKSSDVVGFGLPSMSGGGVGFSLEDDDWDYIDVANDSRRNGSRGVLIVTVGSQFFDLGLSEVTEIEVKCPVLHRVAMPVGGVGDRYSVPFLARIFEEEEKLEGEWREVYD